MTQSQSSAKTVLISGASIAGPALAYWLERYGFDVTVVERAQTVRSGGYPIDVRGTAIDVIERMGLLSQAQREHIDSRKMTFVDAEGEVVGTIRPDAVTGSETGRDIEMPRGALTSLLFDLTNTTSIRYRFNDSIETLNDDGNGVDVRFKSGDLQRYDIVIAADGLHSRTREMVFGPEAQFNHYLGYCFNLYSMPNDLGLSHEAVNYAEAGRSAGVFVVRDNPDVFAFLVFSAPLPTSHPTLNEQRRYTQRVYAGDRWEVPHLLRAMQTADDLYYDTVSQIRMPCWSSGRVVLVGDAAYAPSFLSGQGTSLALVGAYVLAGELASHDNPTDAFIAYERTSRAFVEANQALVATDSSSFFFPRTSQEIEARNRTLTELATGDSEEPGDEARKVHNLLRLPDYPSPSERR